MIAAMTLASLALTAFLALLAAEERHHLRKQRHTFYQIDQRTDGRVIVRPVSTRPPRQRIDATTWAKALARADYEQENDQ